MTKARQAVEYAVRSSGLLSKEIQIELKFDKGHWSRIENGDAPFPYDRVLDFCAVVGNPVLIIWLVEGLKCDWSSLRKHFSDLEQQLVEEKQRTADLERTLALILESKAIR